MPRPFIDDELWAVIEPLLSPPKARRLRFAGRLPLSDRQVLEGIVFVLRTGIRWSALPQELSCGSGRSCWRRLDAWQQAGVRDRLHQTLLSRLRAAEAIDWSRCIVDSSSIRAVGAGQKQDRTPPIALVQPLSATQGESDP